MPEGLMKYVDSFGQGAAMAAGMLVVCALVLGKKPSKGEENSDA